ncbi:MAG: hypothetical protein COT84_06800 [Chlamydiae bacterium CG10_big_fil_rev_8_21_14_0_10_35_9]|nr:MAG: hypothetical protein COT84_06800 [Chlamydiae bacterium CG10_big_fil_rev_8_21_14_0_10_35_9]
MIHAQPIQQESRFSYYELLAHCEVRAIASRIATAVANFFTRIANSITESCCQIKHGIVEFFDPKKKFIEHLLKIPVGQREAYTRLILSITLMEADMLIQAVAKNAVVENDEATFIKNIRPFITSEMYSINNIKIIEIITEDLIQDKGSFINHLQVLTQGLLPYYKNQIIESIADIPTLEREDVIKNASQIINPQIVLDGIMGNIRIDIIKTIFAIPAPKRADVTENARQLITPLMNESDRIKIIKALANLSKDSLNTVPALTQRVLIQVNENQIGAEISRVDIIKVIAEHLNDEVEDLIKYAFQLIPREASISDRLLIIRQMAQIPALERADVTRNALQLIPPEASATERWLIVRQVAQVPARERADVTRNALQLILPEAFATERSQIVRQVAQVPAREREGVIGNVLQLSSPQMGNLEKSKLVQMIAKVQTDKRDSVVTLILRVFPPIRYVTIHLKNLIDTIVIIPAEEREDLIENALQLINPHMHEHDIYMIVRQVAEVPAHVRANFVRNRIRGEQGANFQVANFVARHGVNVHEGTRDQRTKNAVELLLRHQGKIKKTEISKAKEEFIAYLNNSPMDSAQKQLAKDALLTPRERYESFGPLIENVSSILGLPVSGETLIARLWIYASKLSKEEEINAKLGMISALRDSYSYGERVCNQGKAQRLVVAVLQGRLAGVNIEGEIIPKQVSTAQAIGIFLNVEANQALKNKVDLFEAADKFCHENPGVNREEFMHEIESFAEMQEMVETPEMQKMLEEFEKQKGELKNKAAILEAANKFYDENPNVNKEEFMQEIEKYADLQELKARQETA